MGNIEILKSKYTTNRDSAMQFMQYKNYTQAVPCLRRAFDAALTLAELSTGTERKGYLDKAEIIQQALQKVSEVITFKEKSERPAVGFTDKSPNSGEYELEFSKPNEKVTFDDIIGLENAKKEIRRKLINPLAHPKEYARYRLNPGGNILLEGPPGNGKTSFAKATACEVNLPFIAVKCESLVDSHIGATGKRINKMFSEVRRFVAEKKTAAILFLDEFDAIAKSRTGDNKTAEEAVPTLISELDGFDTNNNNIIILAATNLKSMLDSAVLSRFSSVYIPQPDQEARRLIFETSLKQCNVSDEDLERLDLITAAAACDGMSGRDIKTIVTNLVRELAERDSGKSLNDTIQNLLMKLIEEMRESCN